MPTSTGSRGTPRGSSRCTCTWPARIVAVASAPVFWTRSPSVPSRSVAPACVRASARRMLDGSDFAKRHGFEVRHHVFESRLDPASVDRELLLRPSRRDHRGVAGRNSATPRRIGTRSGNCTSASPPTSRAADRAARTRNSPTSSSRRRGSGRTPSSSRSPVTSGSASGRSPTGRPRTRCITSSPASRPSIAGATSHRRSSGPRSRTRWRSAPIICRRTTTPRTRRCSRSTARTATSRSPASSR